MPTGATSTFTVGTTVVTFKFLLSGADYGRKAALSVRHIPGGDVNYYDYAGKEAPTFKGTGQIDSYADLLILQSEVGQTGTLVNSEDTYAVRLLSVGQSRVTGRSGVRFVTLDFVQIV